MEKAYHTIIPNKKINNPPEKTFDQLKRAYNTNKSTKKNSRPNGNDISYKQIYWKKQQPIKDPTI